MTTTSRTMAALVLALFASCEVDDIDHGEADEDFPQRMAEAYCSVLFGCDPLITCYEPPPYASEQDCIASERGQLEEAQAAARGAGLTYDADCVEAMLARYTEAGCDGEERLKLRDRSIFDVCPPYYGTIPEGENPCFEIVGSNFSECGQGLVCTEDAGSCKSGITDECGCAEGTACDFSLGTDDACLPFLAVGDSCLDAEYHPPGVCAVDAYCHWDPDEGAPTTAVCRPRLALGEPCESPSECASYRCEGTCVPASAWLCEDWAAPSHWR